MPTITFVNNINSARPARPSISAALMEVKNQVEYHCFADLRTKWVDPFYGELCLVIAEVFVMDPCGAVKINGNTVNMYQVQEVFRLLRNDHLRVVCGRFQNLSFRVYNKKAYLRTALYNVFFEIESHFVSFEH